MISPVVVFSKVKDLGFRQSGRRIWDAMTGKWTFASKMGSEAKGNCSSCTITDQYPYMIDMLWNNVERLLIPLLVK